MRALLGPRRSLLQKPVLLTLRLYWFKNHYRKKDTRLEVPLLDELPVDEIGVLQERHRRLWLFYVFLNPAKMKHAEKVAAACEAYFGESNHLTKFQSGQLYLGL